jgi:hypothetical protein
MLICEPILGQCPPRLLNLVYLYQLISSNMLQREAERTAGSCQKLFRVESVGFKPKTVNTCPECSDHIQYCYRYGDWRPTAAPPHPPLITISRLVAGSPA